MIKIIMIIIVIGFAIYLIAVRYLWRHYDDDVKKCIGCKNIESENFPFRKQAATGKKGFWIDTEGCGIVQNKDNYYLKIYYCPVCGNSLTKKGKRDV